MTQVLMRSRNSPWGKRIPATVVPSGNPYTLDSSNSAMIDEQDIPILRRYGFEIILSSGNTSQDSSGEMRVSKTALTSEMLNSLSSSPKNLVESPGEGLAIIPHKITWVFRVGTIAFGCSEVAGNLTHIYYSGDESPPILICDESGEFPTFTSDVDVMQVSDPASSYVLNSLLDNRSVILTNDDFDFSTWGAIAEFDIDAAGSGYAVDDTGTITSSDGVDLAEYIITEVGEGDVISLSITTNPGGYRVENGLVTTATSGAGTGLTIDVTEINPGNGTAIIAVDYSVLDVSR